MAPLPTVSLITPTWSGDLEHYRILMQSLAQKPELSGLHTTVVQAEDQALFSQLPLSGLTQLCTTEQVLPPEVEQKRRQALKYQLKLGRHLTRLSSSISRELDWPDWPRYTGWHTQQISKLALAAQAETDYVLVIDSDVIITPSADLTKILSQDAIVCFAEPKPFYEFRGKSRKWVLQADSLLRVPQDKDRRYDSYFDTPFLLHSATVRALLAWLEQEYRQPWWQVLLRQPPRRWSEFATYKLFLQKLSLEEPATAVQWLAPDRMRYIFDTSDSKKLLAELGECWQNPDVHFITVHSQSSGRQRWSADRYANQILELISGH